MIIHIIGCAQSGTSILGELLGSHPDICYIGEQGQHIWHHQVTTGHHRMTEEDVTGERRDLVIDFFTHGGRRLVEKCPPNILRVPYIHAIFPSAKFIHIVRDGRDVACSLVPGLSEGWQHLKPPGWQDIMAAPPLIRGAWLWKTALTFGLEDLSRVDHLMVEYERLVSDPLGIARRVFAYLDMVPTPDVMSFCSKIQDRTRGSYQAAGQVHWYRDDHHFRVGRWKENIPGEKIGEVELMLKPMLERLGYE